MNIAVLMIAGCQRVDGVICYGADASIMRVAKNVANLVKYSRQTLPAIESVELVLANLTGRTGRVVVVSDCKAERDFGCVPDWLITFYYDGWVTFDGPNHAKHVFDREDFRDGTALGAFDNVTEDFVCTESSW